MYPFRMLFRPLEWHPQSAREELRNWGHLAAGSGESSHKFRAADLSIGQFDCGAEIAELEVVDEFVVGGKSAGRSREAAGVLPVEKLSDRPPFVRALDDGSADFEQRVRLGMPQAGGGEAGSGLEMEIETRRMHVLAAMRKAHREICLVWLLVGGETRIAVDAEQRSARGARIGDEIRRDVVKRAGKVSDEAQSGLLRAGLEFMLTCLEPFAIIVAFEATQETEEVGGEVCGHASRY